MRPRRLYDIAALRTRYSARAPVTMFFQVWDRPLMTLNGAHLINDVIELCGGRNVFGSLKPLVPTVTDEAVLAANPEAIVTTSAGTTRSDEPLPSTARWRTWPTDGRGTQRHDVLPGSGSAADDAQRCAPDQRRDRGWRRNAARFSPQAACRPSPTRPCSRRIRRRSDDGHTTRPTNRAEPPRWRTRTGRGTTTQPVRDRRRSADTAVAADRAGRGRVVRSRCARRTAR